MNSLTTSFLLASSVLVPSSAFAGNVLVVAPSGAPYTTVQAAVDAALDGDTVLVRPGTYGGFTLDAKGLSIVADPEGGATITSALRVRSLATTQRATLAGLRYRAESFGGVVATDNAGALRFEALQALEPLGATSFAHALVLEDCADVAVLRCVLDGASSNGGFPSPPGSGLVASDSNVAVHDTHLGGGDGLDARVFHAVMGAQACIVGGTSRVFASGSTFLGGQGGKGSVGSCLPSPTSGSIGAAGGHGIDVRDTAHAWLLDDVVVGGAGGAGGDGVPSCGASAGPVGFAGSATVGDATFLAGAKRVLSCATHVRELQPLTLTFTGEPGDLVWINSGFTPQWQLDLPFHGVRLVGDGSRRQFVGALDATGTRTLDVAFGDLGPGVESRVRDFQAFFRDVSGVSRLGSGAVVVVLDAAF